MASKGVAPAGRQVKPLPCAAGPCPRLDAALLRGTRRPHQQRLQRQVGDRLRVQAEVEAAQTTGGAKQAEKQPKGWSRYETMLVLQPTLNEVERDEELAQFEAFLTTEGCKDIEVSVRGRHRMAYPIKKHQDGIYVMYTYTAQPEVSKKVQLFLSKRTSGGDESIIRHMTFKL
eukprot:evm.model.scf_2125.2 EVM.evm.TU.scf_2125.2   scf_2125:12216-15611(+)